ncbi:MAG: hypothetical protein ACKOAH_20225, partial [Pirellula sp.]
GARRPGVIGVYHHISEAHRAKGCVVANYGRISAPRSEANVQFHIRSSMETNVRVPLLQSFFFQ